MQQKNEEESDAKKAIEWLESLNQPTPERKPTSLWDTLWSKAIEWLRPFKQPTPKQEPTSLWGSLLSERNAYQAAYQRGGANLLVTLIFCELLTAHCIEVYPQIGEENPSMYIE